MGQMKEFFEKFCAEHGEYVQVDDGRLFLFEDGAWHEISFTGCGLSCGPPKKEYELQSAILRYREARLAKAVKAFDAAYERAEKDDYAFMRQDQILADLNHLEAEVKKWKVKCAVTRNRKKRADPHRVWISPEQRINEAKERAEREAKKADFRDKLKKFSV